MPKHALPVCVETVVCGPHCAHITSLNKHGFGLSDIPLSHPLFIGSLELQLHWACAWLYMTNPESGQASPFHPVMVRPFNIVTCKSLGLFHRFGIHNRFCGVNVWCNLQPGPKTCSWKHIKYGLLDSLHSLIRCFLLVQHHMTLYSE